MDVGQIYVALSRATSLEGLQVLRFDPKKVMAHPEVVEWSRNLLSLTWMEPISLSLLHLMILTGIEFSQSPDLETATLTQNIEHFCRENTTRKRRTKNIVVDFMITSTAICSLVP